MDEGLSYRIRRRAFELWELAGRPEGKDRHFWLLAEEDLKHDPKVDDADTGSGKKASPT